MHSLSLISRLRKTITLLRSGYRELTESIFRTMVQAQRDKSNRVFQDRAKRGGDTIPLSAGKLASCQCSQAQLQSPQFQEWAVRMSEKQMHFHRKIWEFCFIAQALYERGLLIPGSRGLAFGVGQEPLPALFAGLGCEIVATDLPTEEANSGGWVETSQHASCLEALNNRGICDPDIFPERVSFRFVDMRRLPSDLGIFDFVWSSCSLEHLGTIALGEDFIIQSLQYLKPGGVSVHTTEYNVLSNIFTHSKGSAVIFRKRDLRRIATRLRQRGCHVDLDFTNGDLPYDFYRPTSIQTRNSPQIVVVTVYCNLIWAHYWNITKIREIE
jgi:hypothetical protein